MNRNKAGSIFWLGMASLILITLCYSFLILIKSAFASPSNNVITLAELLRTRGIDAKIYNNSGGSSFPLNAINIANIRTNGESILLYEFTSDTIKVMESSSISPDGTTYITKGKVITEDYIAPASAHFYDGPNIIVKYIGSSSKILNILEHLYGPQFAGN